MKVLFLTNMPSYHQMEFANDLCALLGADNFRLGILDSVSEERLQMNWQDSYQADYILRFSHSTQGKQQIEQWIAQADVVIQGRFPIKYLRKRIASGGLTFAYQERIWKKGLSIGRFLMRVPHLYKNYWSVNKPNYHLLAAGAYASDDLNRLGLFNNRSWKFGYFIAGNTNPIKPVGTGKLSLVWCARMIDCKQPEKALQIAAKLKKAGIDFELNMIGGGELSQDVENSVASQKLGDCVNLLGWKTVDEVKQYMQAADIMLMTSDQREGWGLVINEAINNRCMLVVSQAAGASKWLVKHEVTGLVYADHELAKTIERLIELCHDRNAINTMAQQGYDHLQKNWSSEVAARRIVQLSKSIIDNNKPLELFTDGPCSRV